MTSTQHPLPRPPRILVVAGSDPTAGAGLQADLKTITRLGGYAMTAVTAITVQDTARVFQVHPLPPARVADQMWTCLDDIGADAMKLGMLASAGIVAAVVAVLADHPRLPVVADPVLAGTGGGTLLDGEGFTLLRRELLPRLTLITPNLAEAAALSGLPVTNEGEMATAARALGALGPAVLVTGGHLAGEAVVDLLWDGERLHRFHGRRIPGDAGFHGTGCVLASAITTRLAAGSPLPEAVETAREYLREAMAGSLALGRGQRLLGG